MIVIPDAFARSTVEREGKPGAAWLAELPGIVDELLERWRCVPDGDVVHGGVGVIVPVRHAEGAAVLKVSFPHPGNVHEPDAFAAWGGRGAVQLYEREDGRFAMLLERARSTNLAEVEDLDEIATVAGRMSRRLAIPAPPGIPGLREQADAWEKQLRSDAEELAHALPQHVVDAAVATLDELGRAESEILIHGDLHPGNILCGDREPWLAVDPKGRTGDRAYDGGTLLKSLAVRLLEADDFAKAVGRTVAVFAEAAELDRGRVRRWVQFHAVEGALWARRNGLGIADFAEHVAGLLTERA
ncbi:aminoglycoside phosphotransferase family protein [Allokutzneria albata]|uniref:Streptomycin 6-kinase n=1 Tax=Allokutzneria albata TaxID=211114 RepID=A0A1G9UMI1_ALLAB|nr:aminoglycoside phosphotransferase family protein [Allokutzneria albata]SDM61150.1 streptomycin 6-kinase [Allokutzneria albata]